MKKDTKDTIQWHPAFQALIQLVTKRVTEEFIRTLSKSITDVDKLAELLNLPVEQINKVLDE